MYVINIKREYVVAYLQTVVVVAHVLLVDAQHRKQHIEQVSCSQVITRLHERQRYLYNGLETTNLKMQQRMCEVVSDVFTSKNAK